MKTIQADLLSITEGVIGHQVNCLGVMGAGVAKQIANLYPTVLAQYTDLCKTCSPNCLLGEIQIVHINDHLSCINIFGQNTVGTYSRQTDYKALAAAADKIVLLQTEGVLGMLHLPYRIGCGLGGGDWNVVQDIFKNVDGYWCQL